MKKVCRSIRPAGMGIGSLVLVAVLAATGAAAEPPATSPYAGFEQRPIKALSEDETSGLLEGRGMGLAMAAELNGHPGPKHVLELAEPLGLTADQRRRTQETFDVMHVEAVKLGRELVETEAEIDRSFSDTRVDAARVTALVQQAAALRGRLRMAHLAAHLRMTEILSAEQVAAYSRLRGYVDHTAPADCPHRDG